MIRMLHDLITELERRSPLIQNMNLANTLQDVALEDGLFNFANVPADLDKVVGAIDALVNRAGFSTADAQTAVENVFSQNFYGSYLELAIYEWLDRRGLRFQAQQPLTAQEVLNPNGVVIDGRFDVRSCFFDIKTMGFQEYVAEQFRQRLQGMLNGLVVMIDGSMDVDVRDIATFGFRQLGALKTALANGGRYQIPQLGWTVRAEQPKPIGTAVRTNNPYALAEQNRYYPFKTAGQFTRHNPFLLIFAYAAQFNNPLFTNFAGSSEIMLRALARRAFIQFSGDATPATTYDAQVAQGVRLSEASRLLSGLLFINVDSGEAQLFLNPRATNPLTDQHVREIFDFTLPVDLAIDDFSNDNY